jgi:hypothetical protein
MFDKLSSTLLTLDDLFDETVEKTGAWGTCPELMDNGYTINVDDVEAVSVIKPNFHAGPWIAGGAPLRWFQGLAVGSNDIDVFCRNAKQAQDVIASVKSYGRYTTKYQSENAVTLKYENFDKDRSWTIQIITKRYFSSLQEVIDNFDISVCQIGTCGNEWIMNDLTAKDIREKNLRFVKDLHSDAPKRLVKYWTYGYRPVPGTLESIQQNPDSNWQFSNDEDYGNAF